MQDKNEQQIQDPEYNRDQDEQEMDLMELGMKLWDARKFLIKWVAAGIVVGLIVAFSIPKEYTTSVVLAPELKDSKSSTSGLSSLASLAGINLDNSTEAMSPIIYPDIVSSKPFTVGLFDVHVTTSDPDDPQTFTVREYMEDETSGPWWGVVVSLPFKALGAVMSAIRGEEEADPNAPVDYYRLNRDQMEIVEALNKRISTDVDTQTGIITVNVTMQDPLVAAMLADTVVERLQTVVTEYRTNKARVDMDYAQLLNDEAKGDYHDAQSKYANYVDRNQNITHKSGQVELERLQNEASLAFNLYNQTAQKLQMAKAKVQEMAPVYTTIQPATVPVKASKPSKPMILVAFVFLAFLIGAAWIIYGQGFVATMKEKRQQSKQEKNEEKTAEKHSAKSKVVTE